ncbi:MAG: D-alanyl-D-alanine dipeptidase [Caldithrix sp.]|nr:D-alanyl-D-alanine dipeptidase [Caldithrix sp.]
MFKKTIFLSCFLFIQLASSQKAADWVEINKVNSEIQLDIRYATTNNFLGQAVYEKPRCFVRYAVAVKLDSIQNELETIKLGLKIFDGYRPLSVQKKMWQILPDSRYVANPANGSRHNRGAAVDVSLVDSSGNELNMPTDFDDFSRRAHQDYYDLPAEVLQNRWILKTLMTQYGFTSIRTEWWHYDLKGWQQFPVTDQSFSEIATP